MDDLGSIRWMGQIEDKNITTKKSKYLWNEDRYEQSLTSITLWKLQADNWLNLTVNYYYPCPLKLVTTISLNYWD